MINTMVWCANAGSPASNVAAMTEPDANIPILVAVSPLHAKIHRMVLR